MKKDLLTQTLTDPSSTVEEKFDFAKDALENAVEVTNAVVQKIYANFREEVSFIQERAGETIEEAKENMDGHLGPEALGQVQTECALISMQLSIVEEFPTDYRDLAHEDWAREWALIDEE